MSNPFQHRTGYYLDITGHSGSQRRSSYASVVSGAGPGENPPRAGAFSYLLNPADGGADENHLSSPAQNSAQGTGHTMGHDGSPQNGAGGSLYQTRTQPLPSFSQAFEMFISRHPFHNAAAPGQSTANTFFVPSYLKNSAYITKLEQAYNNKLAAKREAANAQSRLQGGSSSSSGGDLAHSSPPPPSHRGMTHHVIERAPPKPETEEPPPLPSRWSSADKANELDVPLDGLDVKQSGTKTVTDRDHEAFAVRADHPIPEECGLYYFEITILSRNKNDSMVSIGFSGEAVPLSRAVGWEENSWGYHSDDGNCYASQNVGKHYGPTFSSGDTVGCGINLMSRTAFFTKNGEYLGPAFRQVQYKLYPSVALKKNGEHIRANFGQSPFVFDIDCYMKHTILSVQNLIAGTSTDNLAPPLKETELIQQLVLQFLQHDGYVETARAFAEELFDEKTALNMNPNVEIEGINVTDDEDARNRQRIRRAILEGDIDKALKYTTVYYPRILEDNEPVHFRLRCRKFIEMVRREAEMNLLAEKQVAGNGHSFGHGLPEQGEDMDVDEKGPPILERMDTEDGAEPQQQQAQQQQGVRDLTQEALKYGRKLQAEYHGDPRREVKQALGEMFALMAYSNPLKEPTVAHLLDRRGRAAVAEELNSAILLSLGRSSRSALENLYAQTSVLLEGLQKHGGMPAFVSLQSIFDEVPKPQGD